MDKLIRKFKNDSYPTIAVTVDLLTTGIDVPKICNLVFLRKVKSINFNQSFGKDKTPEDYLESFKQYIKENEDKIEVLKILKTNPKAFTKKDLKDIKSKLDAYVYSKTKLILLIKT